MKPAAEAAAPAPRNVVLLVNPAANGHRDPDLRETLSRLRARGRIVDLLRPASAAEAAPALRRAVAAGLECLVVSGGDGTLNLVLNELPDLPCPVVLVPRGTANDLATALDLPGFPDLREAKPVSVDVVQINDRARFCTIGGFGVPATVARNVNRGRGVPIAGRLLRLAGRWVYPGVGAATILAAPERPFTLNVRHRAPGEDAWRSLSLEACGAFVANQPSLGGSFLVSPGSRNDDGVVEICVLPRQSPAQLLATMARMMAGRPCTPQQLVVVSASQAVLETDADVRFFGDGETLIEGRRFHVTVAPRALTILR